MTNVLIGISDICALEDVSRTPIEFCIKKHNIKKIRDVSGKYFIEKKYLPLIQKYIAERSYRLKYKKDTVQEKKVTTSPKFKDEDRKRFFSYFPNATEQDFKNFHTESWFPDIDPFPSLKEDPELDK